MEDSEFHGPGMGGRGHFVLQLQHQKQFAVVSGTSHTRPI